jgi:hypothetical protein
VLQRLLATVESLTGLAESKGWPDPILEVQWAAATTGCKSEDKRSLVSVTAEVEVAAVPVAMVAVQWGDAGTRWEEFVPLAFASPLLPTFGFVAVERAA